MRNIKTHLIEAFLWLCLVGTAVCFIVQPLLLFLYLYVSARIYVKKQRGGGRLGLFLRPKHREASPRHSLRLN